MHHILGSSRPFSSETAVFDMNSKPAFLKDLLVQWQTFSSGFLDQPFLLWGEIHYLARSTARWEAGRLEKNAESLIDLHQRPWCELNVQRYHLIANNSPQIPNPEELLSKRQPRKRYKGQSWEIQYVGKNSHSDPVKCNYCGQQTVCMHLDAARPEEDTDLYENKRAPCSAPFQLTFLQQY
jgi:hypothetical protein